MGCEKGSRVDYIYFRNAERARTIENERVLFFVNRAGGKLRFQTKNILLRDIFLHVKIRKILGKATASPFSISLEAQFMKRAIDYLIIYLKDKN